MSPLTQQAESVSDRQWLSSQGIRSEAGYRTMGCGKDSVGHRVVSQRCPKRRARKWFPKLSEKGQLG